MDLTAKLALFLGMSVGINLILGYAIWITANYIGEQEKNKND